MKPSQRKHEKKLDLINNQGHTNKNSRIPLLPLKLAKLVLERIWENGKVDASHLGQQLSCP